jgi:hypothetical protein
MCVYGEMVGADVVRVSYIYECVFWCISLKEVLAGMNCTR